MSHYLYHGSDDHAWHTRSWTFFDKLSTPKKTHVVLPIYSIAGWAMGRPLDAEEVVGSYFLDSTLRKITPAFDALVLPPFRFTPKQSIGSFFGMDIELAHQALIETITSAAQAGFQRFILFNTSPFLEEWIDVAARDLRVNHDLQMFCLNLSGVGVDFHPYRGGGRIALQKILTQLLQAEAETDFPLSADALDPIPNTAVMTDRVLPETLSADELIIEVTNRLATLFQEIAAHAPLAPHQASRNEFL